MNFKAPEKYQKVLRRKYRDFTIEGPAFKINDSKFCIDRSYVNSINKSDAEVVQYYSKGALHLLNTCTQFQVPINLKNVCLIKDDEIDTCQVEYNAWRLIFLGSAKLRNCSCLATEQCDYFKFVHEIFHAWSGLKYENLEAEEIFTELVSTVALIKTARTPEALKMIQGIISNPRCNYIARSNHRQGKYLSMMQDPEQALRNILKTISGGTVHV